MALLLYHNPRCSKSRQALQLLRERGIEPHIVHYLETPPTAEELTRILRLLGREPEALMRVGEPAWREAGLDDPDLTRAERIRRMVAHPRVIERPIVVNGDRAAVGRPPERALDVLQEAADVDHAAPVSAA